MKINVFKKNEEKNDLFIEGWGGEREKKKWGL